MSAIIANLGLMANDCSKVVLSKNGGEGEGQEMEVRKKAAREVCSEGYSQSIGDYHRHASDRFEAQLPKTREDLHRGKVTWKEIGETVLPVLIGPIGWFFGK